MSIIPRKTKYRFTFRNKLQTKKIMAYDRRMATPSSTKSSVHAWIPEFPLPDGVSFIKLNKPQYQKYECHQLLLGNYGILFEKHGKLSAKFVETMRLDIAKILKKKSRVWLRVCCDTPVTARPVETRMGKGKGAISFWEARVRPGQIFFEFSNMTYSRATEILGHLQKKSPVRLKLINGT